jgi:hypothetical protein
VWISFVVLAITLIVACVEATRQPFNAFERIVLLLTFGGALLQTYVLLFLIDGSYVGGQFEFMSAGVQGRYFIPFCLAGYLALKQNVFTLESRVLAPFVLSAETLYALVCLRIMGQAYRL